MIDMIDDKSVTPESYVSCYKDMDLTKIGIYLPSESSYNYNFYRLPNGTIVLLQNDDDGFNRVLVKMPSGELEYVGAQYDNDKFMLGDFY